MNHFLYETEDLYWSDSYRFLKSDGNYAYLFEKGYLTRNDKMEPIRMIGASRDITLQKETELILKSLNEKLEKRAEQLVNSNLELERFAYVASHDLQEPLRMVSSFLQLLQKKYESQLDETGNKYIHLAVDGADRMKRLISDLLQFSRVSSTAIALQPVDTNEVVEELKNLFKNKLFESGGVIHSSNLPVIMADKTPITQLLQNLIGNALKYRSDAPPEIWVDCKEEAGEYIFSIKDNGLGIDPKFFEKIFVIFQRLHNKNEYSGTGIGLAICKKIVDRFNGRIWVASEPGKGSTFSFSFPK
jgi:two-component system CheB/CheR fusion protein